MEFSIYRGKLYGVDDPLPAAYGSSSEGLPSTPGLLIDDNIDTCLQLTSKGNMRQLNIRWRGIRSGSGGIQMSFISKGIQCDAGHVWAGVNNNNAGSDECSNTYQLCAFSGPGSCEMVCPYVGGTVNAILNVATDGEAELCEVDLKTEKDLNLIPELYVDEAWDPLPRPINR